MQIKRKKGRMENLSFRIAFAEATCILLFSHTLTEMDYKLLVQIMYNKMLGSPVWLTSESEAQLPAEREIQTLLHNIEKEILFCLGVHW